jgi:hypothetical protein
MGQNYPIKFEILRREISNLNFRIRQIDWSFSINDIVFSGTDYDTIQNPHDRMALTLVIQCIERTKDIRYCNGVFIWGNISLTLQQKTFEIKSFGNRVSIPYTAKYWIYKILHSILSLINFPTKKHTDNDQKDYHADD